MVPRYRNIHEKKTVINLPYAIRITVPLGKFNRSNQDLYSSYLQLMDSTNLTYEKIISIVNQLCTSFRFGSLKRDKFRSLSFFLGPRTPFYAQIRLRLLSHLHTEINVKKSHRGLGSPAGS
ncbi:unnamed protein product [Hymenolepis diminuta]|uniref:Uncharacterized protein n=1 Tax=Hymenolepis diminuta TaxID=6216 RepID=A0A564YZK0_HYMDI|nr:unnamed protein product [Hymenolepis diminuta]